MRACFIATLHVQCFDVETDVDIDVGLSVYIFQQNQQRNLEDIALDCRVASCANRYRVLLAKTKLFQSFVKLQKNKYDTVTAG